MYMCTLLLVWWLKDNQCCQSPLSSLHGFWELNSALWACQQALSHISLAEFGDVLSAMDLYVFVKENTSLSFFPEFYVYHFREINNVLIFEKCPRNLDRI